MPQAHQRRAPVESPSVPTYEVNATRTDKKGSPTETNALAIPLAETARAKSTPYKAETSKPPNPRKPLKPRKRRR